MVQATRSVLARKDGSPEKGWSIDFATKVVLRAALSVALLLPAVPSAVAFGAGSTSVIVRAPQGSTREARQLTTSLGGRILRRLPIIDGFSASVPSGAVRELAASDRVLAVSPDSTLRPMSDGYSASSHMGSMLNVTTMTGARAMWAAGYTGKGVDIALIDSGVVPVEGLKNGKIINGPDLSFESQAPNRRYLDTFGHGTHLAGIIAGRSGWNTASWGYALDTNRFLGMAPDSRIVSVKVADAYGATDVSQVIAAIGWVVQHRNDNGMNIRVLNLSYGTNSTQSYKVDPLSYAAEVAWRKGIVVVTAAGNAGYAEQGTLTNPARDPWVLAVGASESKGTLTLLDDQVCSFSSSSNWGNDGSNRLVDLVAPGRSIVSLRVPGSSIDLRHPNGRVSSTLFKGSGTSQSAAVVSGAAALVLQQRPGFEPDEVKRLLTHSATLLDDKAVSQGNGALNLVTALLWPNWLVAGYDQSHYLTKGTGTGSIEGSRGDHHLVKDGVTLKGEKDIFGRSFNSSAMATAQANGNSWSGGIWNGNSWSGNSWSGNSWSGVEWTGNSWSGNSWSDVDWNGNSWSGNSWSGNSWSGNDWTGNSWSGNSWSNESWSSAEWQ